MLTGSDETNHQAWWHQSSPLMGGYYKVATECSLSPATRSSVERSADNLETNTFNEKVKRTGSHKATKTILLLAETGTNLPQNSHLF